MGAHAEYAEQPPAGCRCEWTTHQGSPGWHLTKLNEQCGKHGRPENLDDDATRRQREIAERKWQ